MTSCVYIIMDVIETQQTVKYFKCWICFCPAGDEPHQSLSRVLTVPGKTTLWVCLSWQSPPSWPNPIPGTNLRKSFQRGSALVTGL